MCGLISAPDFFDEQNDENINNKKNKKEKQKAYIEQNWDEICEFIIDKLNTSKSFSKYGISINFLKMTRCRLNNDSSLEILYELKQLGMQNDSNGR